MKTPTRSARATLSALVAAALTATLGFSAPAVAAPPSDASSPTSGGEEFQPLYGAGPTSGGTVLTVPAIDERPIEFANMTAYRGVAVDGDGALLSWGDGTHGDGTGEADSYDMREVALTGALAGKRIVQVAAGFRSSFAVADDGTLIAWGSNEHGELGQGDLTPRDEAVQIPRSTFGGEDVVAVSTTIETRQVAALTAAGTVYLWGADTDARACFAQGGARGVSGTPEPLERGALEDRRVTKLFGTVLNFYMVTEDGRLFGCGGNAGRNLADGTTAHRRAPVAFRLPGGAQGHEVVKVASAGWRAHAILLSNGTL